jgi:SET domain-containing protein
MKELNRDFTRVKTSSIHGSGVFAKRNIPKGTRIFEYAGARVLKSNLATDLAAGLTSLAYVMNLNETTAIDGERGGNDARFINHSCNPNCEVLYFNETPYIYSIRQIDIDEELSFDYQYDAGPDVFLSEEEKKKWFPCFCGAENCRGTLIHD